MRAGVMLLATPLALAVLAIVVPVAVALLVRSERRRRNDLARFGDPSLLAHSGRLPSDRERVLRGTLVVIALVLMLVALARPQWGESDPTQRAAHGDVFFLLDLSRSMNAQDVEPSRLEAAKRAASAIARGVPDGRVALLVFGGSGFLQLPPTLDHSTFERFLETASSSGIPDVATNFEAAADLAAAIVTREGDSTGAAVVFLTDGEDTEGKLMSAIGTFRRAGIRVHTVGFGTPEGATIPDRDSAGRVTEHRDYVGRVVLTQLRESNLRDIARLTGGAYVRWSGEQSIRSITVALSELHSRARTSNAGVSLSERFQWPLALALIVLFLEAFVIPSAPFLVILSRAPAEGGQMRNLLSLLRDQPSRSALLLYVLTSLSLSCSGGLGTLARRGRAEQLYDARDFKSAYGAYRGLAQTTSPSNTEALATMEYNSGDAAYRMGKFQDAVRHFRGALAGPPSLQQHAQYNLGNSYVWLARAESDKRGSLRAAVNAYEEAVLLDPGDVDAKWNLELAVAKLAQEQQRLGGGPHREANWGGGNLTKSGYAGTPQTGAGATPGGGFGAPGGDEVVPEITESDARKMLKEAEQAQVTGQDVRRTSRDQRESRRKDW